MKTKTLRNWIVVIILFLSIGCLTFPLMFGHKSKAEAEIVTNANYILLEGDVPLSLAYQANSTSASTFITPNTTIPFSANNTITFVINPDRTNSPFPSTTTFARLNANGELEKCDMPTEFPVVTQLEVTGTYTKAGASAQNFSILKSGSVGTNENAQFVITKNDNSTNYSITNYFVDGNQISSVGPGEYVINISYTYRLSNGSIVTTARSQFNFSIIDDEIYNQNNPTFENVDTPTTVGTEGQLNEYSYNFNKINNDGTQLLYPQFTFNTKLYQYNIERNVAGKIYYYRFQNIDTANKKINYSIYYGNQLVGSTSYDIVMLESGAINTTLVFKELGEYTLTPTLIDSNGAPYKLPEANQTVTEKTKTLVIYGYILNYTSADGTKIELNDLATSSWASISASNTIKVVNDTTTITTPTSPKVKAITNQVPLVFDYLGTLIPTETYSGGSISAPGNYDIDVEYTYTSQKGVSYTGKQTFEFIIDNSNPDIYVGYKDADNTYSELNQKYINKDIYIGVNNNSSPFMAPVKVKVDKYNYTTKKFESSYELTQTSKKIDGTDYSIYSITENTASLSGEYRFEVSYIYGPNQSVEKATYIIDKSNVNGIKFYTMGTEGPADQIAINNKIALTNTTFTYSWNYTKDSGATTWAKYTFAPINNNDAINKEQILLDAESGITNGYSIISYDPTSRIVYGDEMSNNQYSYNGLGVYFISFEDEAGNSVEYIVVNDQSLPYLLQQTRVNSLEGEDIYEDSYNPNKSSNIVTDRTKLIIGDYKLIQVDDSTAISKLQSFGLIKSANGISYLATKVNASYGVGSDINTQFTNITNDTAVIYKNQQDANNPIDNTFPIVSTTENNIFTFKLADSNGNVSNRLVWMNLDKSQFQALITVNNSQYVTIYPDDGTNNNNLSLQFYTGGDSSNFEVEAIIVNYYPFVTTSESNYPFASTPTLSATLYKKGDTSSDTESIGGQHENYTSISRLLTITNDDGEQLATISNFNLDSNNNIISGMYTFERIYTDDTPNDEDDPKVYVYNVFVDKNSIVDKTQNIGNFINVTVGFAADGSNTEQKSFISWDRKVDGQYAFITNKLPTKLFIPYSKYYDGTNSSQYDFSNLNVQITYKEPGKNEVKYNYTYNTRVDDYLDISNLSGAGVYTVVITDNTGYSISTEDGNTQFNINPNRFEFQYKIEHTAPEINVIAGDKTLDSINNNFYTNINSNNENQLYATWSDPIDPYFAKVKQIVIDSSTTIDIGTDSDLYKLCSANIDKTINYNNTGLIITLVKEYEYDGQKYYQFSYQYNFDISGTQDKVFTIQLTYSGNIAQYTYNNTNFATATYTINLDRTRPDTNIDNLYNNDAYLQSIVDLSKYNDFKNLTSSNITNDTPNIENYIFAVDQNFVLKSETNEYSEFYIRKISNKNSSLAITPDHYLYGQYGSYNGRFDFQSGIATILGYKTLTYNNDSLLEQIKQIYSNTSQANYSGYYEIIERDYAGNYRTYVVYMLSPDEENKLFEFGNSNISNLEPSYTVIREWQIPSFSSKLSWYTLKINDQSFVFKNNDNDINTIANINSYIASEFNTNTTFNITLLGSKTASTVVRAIFNHIKFTSQDFNVSKFESVDGTVYEIIMPTLNEQSGIILTSLKISKNGKVLYNQSYADVTNIPARLTNNMFSEQLTSGLYTFTITDNYTDATMSGEYSFVVAIDVADLSDSEKYQYSQATYLDQSTNTTYTSGFVTVNYLKDYSIKIRRNGIEYIAEITEEDNIRQLILEAPEYITSTLSNATGDKYVYEIEYYINNQQVGITKNIVIYNKISKINVNYLDNTLVPFDEKNNTTSKAIKFSWETFKDADIVNDFTATLDYLDDSGQILITDNYIMGTTINPQPSTNRYRFNLTNNYLGYSRSVEFTISTTEVKLYSVEANNEILNPSPVELDLNSYIGTSTVKVIDKILSEEKDVTLQNIIKKCSIQTEQYYTNKTTFNVITNADNNLKVKYYIFRNGSFVKTTNTFEYNSEWINDYITYVTLIYGQTNPIYEKLIGVTIVPTTTRFATDNYLQYIDKNQTQRTIDSQRIILRNDYINNSQVDIVWNINYTTPTWYNSGNIVYINYTYANSTTKVVLGEVYNNTMYKQTISGAGNHTIELYDWAGNKSRFGAGSTYQVDYCTITIIDKVVYTINSSTPIQHAIYNSSVVLDIDSAFSTYYLPNSLSINVKKDGATYTDYKIVDKAYVFEETGRYEIYINARYSTTGTELSESNYNFSIINPNSARLAWEFSGIDGYEITKVIKNQNDITAEVKGNKRAITSLYLSTSDQNYGIGVYTITISAKTNSIANTVYYTFTVRINDEVPVIKSTPDYGETTKKYITIEYNPGQIYDQIGASSIKVLTYNEDSGTFNLFGEIKITDENAEQNNQMYFTLTQTNDYYIQLVTDSGNIALSFRVNRAEPLNAIAIILIVVFVVTVVVLVIIFIKLRTKMKIR